MMAKRQTVSAKVDRELMDKVREKAGKLDITVSQLIRRALRRFAYDLDDYDFDDEESSESGSVA